jgi:hypothetical protein
LLFDDAIVNCLVNLAFVNFAVRYLFSYELGIEMLGYSWKVGQPPHLPIFLIFLFIRADDEEHFFAPW